MTSPSDPLKLILRIREHQLSLVQAAILVLLDRTAWSTNNELVNQLPGVTQPQVSQSISSLIGRDLVVLDHYKVSDRRVRPVSLTLAGRRVSKDLQS